MSSYTEVMDFFALGTLKVSILEDYLGVNCDWFSSSGTFYIKAHW